jgi:predicted TIM-barrel fold metal-dependent hydrolase
MPDKERRARIRIKTRIRIAKDIPRVERRVFRSGRPGCLHLRAISFFVLSLACLMQPAALAGGQNPAPAFETIEKIDVHVHIFDDLPEFVEMLRRTRTRVVNICVGASQPGLMEMCETRAEELHQRYGADVHFASTFDLTRRDAPGYADQVAGWLDGTFRAGAVMVKLWKEAGMALKTPDGSFLMPDDPLFDPVYAFLAERRRPLMAHLADPIDAWLPLDPQSPHYGYFRDHPEWHLFGKNGYPAHDEILAARDRILARHPELVLIAAHLGSEAHDLDRLAERFERFPNLYADVSARTFELQRIPAEKVRRFFIRFQDRLLYGTDTDKYTEGRLPTPEERSAFTATMEKTYRADFDYYAGKPNCVPVDRRADGLNLPIEVLEKFYHHNALRLMPGLAAP